MRGSVGVVLLGGVCAGAAGAAGELASYGGGGWSLQSKRNGKRRKKKLIVNEELLYNILWAVTAIEDGDSLKVKEKATATRKSN